MAARLVRKGVPLAAAITFMLANPILNPVPVYATATAFPYQPELVLLRAGAAYLYAVAIGLALLFGVKGTPLRVPDAAARGPGCPPGCGHGPDAAGPSGAPGAPRASGTSGASGGGSGGRWGGRLRHALEHAGVEFFAVGRYFVVGALLASLVQVGLDRERLAAVGDSGAAGILAMMGLAYALNVCSEADAFVAAGFTGTFTVGALLAFLTLGPMTDVKNTLMMLAVFRRGFVVLLNALIVGAVLLGSALVDAWLYGG